MLRKFNKKNSQRFELGIISVLIMFVNLAIRYIIRTSWRVLKNI